jgi:hypothetical protein
VHATDRKETKRWRTCFSLPFTYHKTGMWHHACRKPTESIQDPSPQKTAEGLSPEERASVPGCPLKSGDLKRAGFSVELTGFNVQQTAQKLSGAVESPSSFAPILPVSIEIAILPCALFFSDDDTVTSHSHQPAYRARDLCLPRQRRSLGRGVAFCAIAILPVVPKFHRRGRIARRL